MDDQNENGRKQVINNLQNLAKLVEEKADWTGPKLVYNPGQSLPTGETMMDNVDEKLLLSTTTALLSKPTEKTALTDEDVMLIEWMNKHLASINLNIPIPDDRSDALPVAEALSDGSAFLLLFEVLTQSSVGFFNRQASIFWQKLQNIILLLRLLAEQTGNKVKNCEAQGLIFSLS